MTEKHTLRSFDEALENLSSRVSIMGQQVVEMVETAGSVFRDADAEGAQDLVRRDLEVDHQQDELNAAVVEVLSRFNPVARDLREVLATEHVVANLERIGDHAKGIAKRSITSPAPTPSGGAAEILDKLHGEVVTALRNALHAFATRDAALADLVRRGDEGIDHIYDDLFHSVVANLRTGHGAVLGDVQTLFVGKGLERIGDRATNIAEEVRFMTKGDLPPATRET